MPMTEWLALPLSIWEGRAIARVVSRRLPTRWDNVAFVVDKVALGQVFSEYFEFSCQFSFHLMPHTHLLSGAGTVGQFVADVPSGLSLTPPHEIKKIYLRGPRFKSRLGDRFLFLRTSWCSSVPLDEWLDSTSFPVHYSLTIPPFDTV
jgi:hypothetical protein